MRALMGGAKKSIKESSTSSSLAKADENSQGAKTSSVSKSWNLELEVTRPKVRETHTRAWVAGRIFRARLTFFIINFFLHHPKGENRTIPPPPSIYLHVSFVFFFFCLFSFPNRMRGLFIAPTDTNCRRACNLSRGRNSHAMRDDDEGHMPHTNRARDCFFSFFFCFVILKLNFSLM